MNLLSVLMMLTQVANTNDETGAELLRYKHNKEIPVLIEQNVLKALAFFPELRDARISFIFKRNIKGSVMQAQPVFATLVGPRKARRYRINISSQFKLISTQMPIQDIPADVMIGWIGHELGHILDYEGRSNAGLVSFGYNYYFSPKYVKHAEMVADSFAVERGMGNYILATKRFILDHAELPQAYKDKISRLYLSPDVIVEQVRLLEEKKRQE
ncbi:hypothetical protein [Segetibacter sp. 3557_3]|uniref:hypothetical protein n=1 Tax=Segetibacter sp. 3557_3 TaxID=2547429 RepID=UPI001FB62CD8|nr:hypothetical protein [Segetibacter sp. 3557_3]